MARLARPARRGRRRRGRGAGTGAPEGDRRFAVRGRAHHRRLPTRGRPALHGVDRAFVVGVAAAGSRPEAPKGPLAVALAAAEWNQYSETTRALADATRTNDTPHGGDAHAGARQQVLASTQEGERRDRLLAAVDAAFERHNRGRRGPVEIIPILPDHHTKMFFGSFRPERSRS